MRKTMKRFLTTALCTAALALTGGAVATADFTASAATTAPTLTIKGGNLNIDSNVDILFAVETENLDASATVELLVWDAPQTNYTYNENFAISQATAEDAGLEEIVTDLEAQGLRGFVYDQLELKEIVDYVYACAYTEVNGISYYSPVIKYGVLQYAYNMRAKIEGGTASEEITKQASVVEAILDLGAAMQDFKDYKTPEVGGFYANSDELVQVTVNNAAFSDGFGYGVYPAGAALTVTPNLGYQLAEELPAHITVDEAGAITFTVPTGSTTFEDTTSFVSIPASEGLAFTLNSDEASYSVSMGDCTDTEIIIPAVYSGLPVTAIGAEAFKDQTAITSVSIPSSVTTIGANAFEGCSSLKELTLPEGVTTVGNAAFYGSGLETLNLPASANSISSNAFENASVLATINVDVSSSYYTSIDGNLYSKNGDTLYAYAIGKTENEFTLPVSTTTIGAYAFKNASNLTAINLHDNISEIGGNAFELCTALKSIVLPEGLYIIDVNTFDSCTALAKVVIPTSMEMIQNNAFATCTSLTEVYYGGTASNWEDIVIGSNGNDYLKAATKYCYTESYFDLGGMEELYGSKYGVGEEYQLNDKVSFISSGNWIVLQIRLYQGGNVVLSSQDILGGFSFTASKAGVVDVYVSENGVDNWNKIETITTVDASSAYSLEIPDYAYKYIKLEMTSGEEIRITDLTLGTYSA